MFVCGTTMFEVIFLERMEIEHLLRYLDTDREGKNGEERMSQLHRIRSRHISELELKGVLTNRYENVFQIACTHKETG